MVIHTCTAQVPLTITCTIAPDSLWCKAGSSNLGPAITSCLYSREVLHLHINIRALVPGWNTQFNCNTIHILHTSTAGSWPPGAICITWDLICSFQVIAIFRLVLCLVTRLNPTFWDAASQYMRRESAAYFWDANSEINMDLSQHH